MTAASENSTIRGTWDPKKILSDPKITFVSHSGHIEGTQKKFARFLNDNFWRYEAGNRELRKTCLHDLHPTCRH